jgi:hypothetical protein
MTYRTTRIPMHARLRMILVLAVVCAATGCQTIGPGSVQRDRMDYAGAIAGSWREQTLLNIVKLRYFDAPVFLEVSSVISSYTLQGEVSLASRIFPFSRGDTFHELGATGTYTDRPTISYTPVTGQKYIEKLLRPIPPQAIFAMIQAGHQADFILSLTVRAINDIYNFSASPARSRQGDPTFFRVIEAIRRIQQMGALSVRTEKRASGEVTLLLFQEKGKPDTQTDIRFVKDALGINPETNEVLLTYGSARRAEGEVALLTRSMWEILAELSAGVEVPEQDTAEGRATATPRLSGRPGALPIAHIHASGERPANAYIAARYRDTWFWVDDRDLGSKRVFTFLMVFSSIAETGAVPQVPILTIPAN